MDERELSDVLDLLAEEVPVGAVPLREITAPSRPWVPWAAAAAVAVIVGGVGFAVVGGDRAPREPSPAEKSATSSPPEPGPRLMGVGSYAIEIPESWAVNATHCGTPMKNTVIVDEGPICMALVPRPADVETIRIEPLKVVVDLVGEPVSQREVLGVDATMWDTTCRKDYADTNEPDSTHDDVRVCSAAVWLHGDADVRFTAEAATKERAEELLATIQRVEGRKGLPGPNQFEAQEGSGHDRGPSKAGQRYRDAVADAGGKVKLVEESQPGLTPGMVLGVKPAPGTMIAPGDVVTVRVVAAQNTLAERVSVGLSWGEGGDDTSLTDAEVRAGRTVRVPVGTRVWAYYTESDPVQRGDVAEEMTGGALVRDHRNGPLWSYVASKPGRSTYTLSVGGEVIGRVTIVVTG